MNYVKVILFLICLGGVPVHSENPAPAQALQKLIEGNQRFINGGSLYPNRAAERRKETSEKQEPFAIIVGCSDSRVSPEIIFDQGIGDLFIVRNAGNVVGPISLDSIEFSSIYLHSSLILVLCHENCSAVRAVVEGETKDIENVAALIEPAKKIAANESGDRVENTIKANARLVVAQLKQCEALKKLIDQDKLMIKAGYYNFHSGEVELLKD